MEEEPRTRSPQAATRPKRARIIQHDHKKIHYEADGHIDHATAWELQQELGYPAEGYGMYGLTLQTDPVLHRKTTRWWSGGSCD